MILWKLLLENLNIVRFSVSLNEDNLIQASPFYLVISQFIGKEIIMGEVSHMVCFTTTGTEFFPSATQYQTRRHQAC